MHIQEPEAAKNAAIVNIEDYMLNKSPSEYVKAESISPYKVILQNSRDFIVARKKGKVEKELVVLISKGLFYFKQKERVEEITIERLQTFLKDLGDFCITLDKVAWMRKLNKDAIGRLMDIITNPSYIAMAQENVLTEHNCRYGCTKHWEEDSELFKKFHAVANGMSPYNYENCMGVAYEIKRRFGYDEALYFIKMLEYSDFERFSCSHNRNHYPQTMDGFFQLLDTPYSLDLRRLIDYTFIDTHAQGIRRIEAEFWQTYEKYLKMQMEVFGEIREKYPRYLMAAHDVMMKNLNLLEYSPPDEKFEELMTEVQSLAHEDDEYSIVIPLTARQIAEEGIALNHCMGSNPKRIASGDMQILFLRRCNEKDKPLVTLQFSRNRITNAEGLHRRGLTDSERKFLESWGNKNNVQIAA